MASPRQRRLREALRPLEHDAHLAPLVDAIGGARVVLLGEASHGTHEYYTWRARLSRRLIAEQGFTFIAVEADWPDCYDVNRFIKGRNAAHSAEDALAVFHRWPTWMWANREVADLCAWLREHNDARGRDDEKVGFYGLDVYSLWSSLERVLDRLEEHDGGALGAARRAFSCLEPYAADPYAYARATALASESCEEEMVALLDAVRARTPRAGELLEDRFSLEQDARAALSSERYYRAMVHGDRDSWNLRETHMADTLDRLLALHGEGAKAIVWAHNTHVGDARATPMARVRMHSLGSLARDRHGHEGVYLVGFAGHRGRVLAAREWGADVELMVVPEARAGSVEDVLFRAAERSGLLFTADAAEDLGEPIPQRAIGVVYDPLLEPWHNYVPSLLPQRYDALLFLEVTEALSALPLVAVPEPEPPETYPSAM